MTQHEHGPFRDADVDEPTGYTAAIATMLAGAAVLILIVMLVVGA